MKKLPVLCMFFLGIISCYAQTDSVARLKVNPNELKLNLLYSVVGKLALPEISYERLIENQNAVGLSVAGKNESYNIDFIVTPHFRYYFPKTHKTFFLELNVALLRGLEKLGHDLHGSRYEGVLRERKVTNGGFGGAFGLKLMFSESFVMDAYFGLGKIIESNSDSYRSQFVYPRIGISIGPRF